MDPLTIGILVTVLIFGVAGFFLFSTTSGVTSITKALGVGGAAGIVGSITAIFTDAWQFVVAAAYGNLGLYGYILIGGIVACLVVWAYNGYKDVKLNRPIGFVD